MKQLYKIIFECDYDPEYSSWTDILYGTKEQVSKETDSRWEALKYSSHYETMDVYNRRMRFELAEIYDCDTEEYLSDIQWTWRTE